MTNINKERSEQELIDKYLERSLTPAEEQGFHNSLASNRSLRELFRAEVILLQASAETITTIPAPERFTRGLFSKLDLNLAKNPLKESSRRVWPIVVLAVGSIGAGYFMNEWKQSATLPERTETIRYVEPKQEEIVIQIPKKKASVRSRETVKSIPNHPATAVVEKEPSVNTSAETDKPIEIRLRPWTKDSLSQKP